MKLNYKLKLIVVAVVLGIGHANASQTNKQTTTITQNSDNWVMVQNEKGINVYFSKYKLDETSYLKIKFENTANQSIDFVWSLNKNSEPIVISVDEMHEMKTQLETGNSKFYGIELLYPINNEESLSDFSVIINIK